ncbi:hypothetical protein ACFOON_12190 [Novosphingobium piscinae]|uniref:hypothetical protein n=1 Tax=Novosphingobium piscinae TaxID=1507448 RepID=UPI001C8C7361|nr:hypothetical protein [Novosphingobium piscinae]
MMRADDALSPGDRHRHLSRADALAGRISLFQHTLGAAAACAWSMHQLATPPVA